MFKSMLQSCAAAQCTPQCTVWCAGAHNAALNQVQCRLTKGAAIRHHHIPLSLKTRSLLISHPRHIAAGSAPYISCAQQEPPDGSGRRKMFKCSELRFNALQPPTSLCSKYTMAFRSEIGDSKALKLKFALTRNSTDRIGPNCLLLFHSVTAAPYWSCLGRGLGNCENVLCLQNVCFSEFALCRVRKESPH